MITVMLAIVISVIVSIVTSQLFLIESDKKRQKLDEEFLSESQNIVKKEIRKLHTNSLE